jgi:hypothetical protein
MSSNVEAAKAAFYGPVRKIKWLCGAAGLSDLSRAELAVLIVLADHINTETGKAWPAFGRISAMASVTVRTAKRAVSRLTAKNLVQIAEHGGPGRSNRYRLNWALFEGYGDGVTHDTMKGSLVSPVTAYGDTQHPKIVPPMSPDPINPSEQEAKDEIEGSQAEGVAAPLRLGACGLPPSKDGYSAFWEAWGRKMTVAETERLIDAKLEEGTSMAEIVAGAKRFQKYCADTNKPSRMKPAAFVYGEKWRDDWELYPAEPVKPKSRSKASRMRKPAKAAKAIKAKAEKNPWWLNPELNRWRKEWLAVTDRNYDEWAASDNPGGVVGYKEYVKKKNDEWKEKNPPPPRYRYRITGETWNGDARPASDFSPRKHR